MLARLVWNTDDDNGNGIADYQELTPVAGEDDLLELKLDQYLRSDELTRDWQFDFSFGTDYIRIWDSREKGREIIAGADLLLDDLPDSVWLEGVGESVPDRTYSTLFSVEQALYEHPNHRPPETPFPANDYNRFATRANLTAYRAQHEPGSIFLVLPAVNEEDEEDADRGPGIRLNTDHDNGGEEEDRKIDGFVAGENDLIMFEITQIADGTQQLIIEADLPLVIWTSPLRGTPPLPMTDQGTYFQSQVLDFATSDTITLWAEWDLNGHGNASIRLIDVQTASPGELQDQLVFHSFESLIIGLSGETFNGASSGGYNNPVLQATDNIVFDLMKRGFDAQYFDNQKMNFYGKGAPYNVVVNAIDNRDVNHLGIFGYSHGGGGTQLLADALAGSGWVGPGYATLDATAYIDAVSVVPLLVISGTYNPFAVRSAPPRTMHHGNWYQQNSVFEFGGTSIPGSVPDDDLSNFEWRYEPLNHRNIDEFVDDRDLVETFFERWMSTR